MSGTPAAPFRECSRSGGVAAWVAPEPDAVSPNAQKWHGFRARPRLSRGLRPLSIVDARRFEHPLAELKVSVAVGRLGAGAIEPGNHATGRKLD
jgi:hypothetical protein